MRKSFIERIFPHSPGSPASQYEYDDARSQPSPARSPPRIHLHESIASSSRSSSSRRDNVPPSTTSANNHNVQSSSMLAASLIRHNDPFLPVERAARNLERTLQNLLDAQSEGLVAGVVGGPETTAMDETTSSMDSLTPTPSQIAMSSSRATGEARVRTLPIRQPRKKKTTLREARRRLAKSMAEFAALRGWELRLIDREIMARDDALKQASDLGNRKKLLDDEIQKIQAQDVATGLRHETQRVEREIRELETTLLELRGRHRQLLDQVRQLESSKDSNLSSYTEALTLNENKIKYFLRQPPIAQGLSGAAAAASDSAGMYSLKPARRTLQMAQDQWTMELDMLTLRQSDAEEEKQALEEGTKLWREVVHRIREFEHDLRAQTKIQISQSQMPLTNVTTPMTMTATSTMDGYSTDDSGIGLLSKLGSLVTFLEEALAKAESQNWNLLVCAIGAEVAAFEQARDLLQDAPEAANGRPREDDEYHDAQQQDTPHHDLLGGGGLVETRDVPAGSRSPGESSNQSLEDTLREFGKGMDKGKQRDHHAHAADSTHLGTNTASLDLGSGFGPDTAASARNPPIATSESEDDEPGPEFLLSHN